MGNLLAPHRPDTTSKLRGTVLEGPGEKDARPRGDERRGRLRRRGRAPRRRGATTSSASRSTSGTTPRRAPGSHGRCCAPEDQYDARRTADALGIPHFTFDRRELFAKNVVEPFVDAYLAGETPSPCTACNRGVKLGELFALADASAPRKVATGHYARVDARTARLFARARRDEGPELLPLRDAAPSPRAPRLPARREHEGRGARRGGRRAKLPGATKGESQELCFVGAGAGAYATFVEERAKARAASGPDRRRRRAASSARTTASIASRSASAKGSASRSASPRSSRASTRRTATVHLGDKRRPPRDDGATLDDVVLAPDVTLPLDARARVRYRHEGVRARARRTTRSSSSTRPAPSRRARSRSSTTATASSAAASSWRSREEGRSRPGLAIARASRSRRARGCTVGRRHGLGERPALRPGLLVRAASISSRTSSRRRRTRTTTRCSSASSAAATT